MIIVWKLIKRQRMMLEKAELELADLIEDEKIAYDKAFEQDEFYEKLDYQETLLDGVISDNERFLFQLKKRLLKKFDLGIFERDTKILKSIQESLKNEITINQKINENLYGIYLDKSRLVSDKKREILSIKTRIAQLYGLLNQPINKVNGVKKRQPSKKVKTIGIRKSYTKN